MPKIDLRDFQSLLEEKRRIAPLYTPEWDAADDRDTGVALLKIFTHMQEEIINRLNRVPDKNFTAFLEMIGLKLMPAQPAKAPVTFYLPEGLSGGVFVPAGTKVAADETDKHKVLNFETTNGIFATSAAIEEIYRVDPDNDCIYRYTDDFISKKEFLIFEKESNREESSSDAADSYPNKQEHILYLGHKELFDLKNSGKIELKFNFAPGKGSVEDFRNLIWGYWGEDEEIPEELSATPVPEKTIILKPKNPESTAEIKEKKINDVSSCWIFCKKDKITKSSIVPSITEIRTNDLTEPIKPDLGFYNDIPLDCTGIFSPFGKHPRLFDTFYIASKRAFSKDTKNVEISFNIKNDTLPDVTNVILSWEYWDGTLWRPIKGINISDDTSKFGKNSDKGIKFDRLDNIEEVEVNGKLNHWIRVRLVDGNYGKDEFVYVAETTDPNNPVAHYEIKHNFNAPEVSDFNIYYTSFDERTFLHNCLAYNNLEYRDFTKESKGTIGFKPFIPLPEKYPTLYIGFKDAFKKGNISIFFSLRDTDYPLKSRPKIKWTYWSKAPNLILNTEGTKDITLVSTAGIDSGTELLFEEKIGSETITGTVIVDSLRSNGKISLKEELNYKYTKDALVFKRTNLEVTDNTEYLTKTGTLEFIGPSDQSKTHKFGIESYWLVGEFVKPGLERLIEGIYPNTVWVEQVETIKDEILGSGDGEKNKSYSFFRVPVISPDIWIRYEDIISENEEDTPSSEDIKEIKDDTGKIIEKWVRWKIVDDFADSGPRSRHYIIDNALGTVQFGDGEHGMIPPIGRDNIKVTYKTGGGVLGNVAENEIKTLKSSIAGIDHITNHEPAEGGSDTELLSQIFERGPHLIKHRDRAVTREDFERLAKAASSYIARTKCHIDPEKGNKLTVIVIPKGEEDKPKPSRGLKEVVRKSLLERRLDMIPEESLEIADPSYKEIKVEVSVIPESIDQAIPLEKMVLQRLKEYLHPLTGGSEGTGWEFGRAVHISDIYALLESIKGVDHVENLKLNNSCKDVSIEEFETVCSGEHGVTMKLGS
jgi:hypothetical protein